MLAQITPVILTCNEASNIGRVLEKLTWASDIVVVDSLSTDSTISLVASTTTARIFRRPFDSHAMQWTYALTETGIKTEWVLALDADYILTDGLVTELAALNPGASVNAYCVRFDYCVAGKPLRGSLYPPGIVLFRRAKGRYVQHGHTQRLVIDGTVGWLFGKIRHDDRKPLTRWLASQQQVCRAGGRPLAVGAPFVAETNRSHSASRLAGALGCVLVSAVLEGVLARRLARLALCPATDHG